MNVGRWLPPLIWAGVILFATSLPSQMVPQEVPSNDKAFHFIAYAIFAVLLTRPLTEVTSRWRAPFLALAVTLVFGALDEWHQAFIPGRSAEFADWGADATGATLGAFAFALTRRRGRARVATIE